MIGRNQAARGEFASGVALRQDSLMTIDLFAASFICRDAEMGSIFEATLVKSGRWSTLGEVWAKARLMMAGLIRRRSSLA